MLTLLFVVGVIIILSLIYGAIVDYRRKKNAICCDIPADSEFCKHECK